MIQIDMSMPKCCDECFALDDHGDYPFCLISQDQRGYTFNVREKRMPTCPLKAQEPRVLALDEIHRGMAVWLEDVDKADLILAIGGSSCGGRKCFITVDDRSIAPHDSDYGVRWRAWTREPTAEQRRETHWA